MRIQQFIVDAFTSKLFAGNPAAVCPLDFWLPDELLQNIAAENNLSETAFFVLLENGKYQLRWFTPVAEVPLCGHATLASAHVLFNHLGCAAGEIRFETMSGELIVRRGGNGLEMQFPANVPRPCPEPENLQAALGGSPVEFLASNFYLVIYPDEKSILEIKPDFGLLRTLDLKLVIASAPGDASDFVSRVFAPKLGIDEDPVTGAAHCVLTPYWAKRLGKNDLFGIQVSKRRGEVGCKIVDDKVFLSGTAVTFMEGNIFVDA